MNNYKLSWMAEYVRDAIESIIPILSTPGGLSAGDLEHWIKVICARVACEIWADIECKDE